MLGSWHSPAVRETCRGVTYTGSNRLTCPARLALPAVADSIGLGCFSDDAPLGGSPLLLCLAAFQRWPIARGSSLPRRVPGSICFQVARLFLFVISKIQRTALVLGRWQCPPRPVVIFLRGVSPATQTIEHTLSGMANDGRL